MSKRNVVWAAIIILIALMFYRLTPMVAEQDSVYRTYAPLVEVDALVRRRFVEPVSEERLVDGAIRGMMLQLDPYSRYIPPEEMDAFERRMSARYTGIGVEIGMRHGQVTVIAPIEGSPAARAGILAGDAILAVDGQPTEGLSVLDVDHLLAGSPGTAVSLTVRHPVAGEVETLAVVRGPVSIHSVKGFRKTASGGWDYLIDRERKIGYIRVSRFRENTTVDFDQALHELRSAGVGSLVLDLRFNGGGLLARGVEMVDRFVESGVIVSTVTRQEVVSRYRAKREGTYGAMDLVVLINSGSASASEIVAGALQAHGRATVIGARSFGKGSIQRVVELSERKAAVQLTVAHYELPDGRVVHRTARNADTDDWGVIPDVMVPLTEEQLRRIQEGRSEVDGFLPHLRARPGGSDARAAPDATPSPHVTSAEVDLPEIWIDPQIERALALLARGRGGAPEPAVPAVEPQGRS